MICLTICQNVSLQLDTPPSWICVGKITGQLSMGSDDFITLDSSSYFEHEDEEHGLHESNSVPREGECGTATSPRGVSDGNSLDTFKENDEIEEGEHVQDMDLESDSEQEQLIRNKSTKLVVETAEKASDDVFKFTITDTTTNNLQMDNSCILLSVILYLYI